MRYGASVGAPVDLMRLRLLAAWGLPEPGNIIPSVQ
jgi:hypothetical protein